MALKLKAERHVFHYKSFHVDKSQPLGHGSYGAVYKAKCDQLPCAAKVLHPTILDPTDPGAGKILERFYHECTFLGGICHPHIVQYLGICRDYESRLPVLLMELLDESLTKMLERSQQPLAYGVQVDICHDIALAIAYLHSNDIIHRDLSSNNVLIIAGKRAKVTDFGMSKLAGASQATTTSLTACPGTLAYMPPEALREPPRYTEKLDCFSEGVLMIQVCTQLWPEPGPRTCTIADPRSPTGSTEMPVLDTERRKNHIELIDPSHPFLSLIEKCLSYSEEKRPTASDLCQKLEDLKKKKGDYDNGEKGESYSDLKRWIKELKISEEEKDEKIQELEKELAKTLHDAKRQSENIMRFRQAIQQMKAIMKEQQQEIREKNEEMGSKEKQVKQLTEQLNQQEQITAEFQQTNEYLLRQLDRMKDLKEPHHLFEDDQQRSDSLTRSSAERELSLSWRGEDEAPEPLLRGTAVVDGDIVYFMHQYLGKVYSYNSATKRWAKLLYCPHKESSLAVVRGQLTTIGGRKFELLTSSERILNELFSLCVTARGEEWAERFPPMPTKRYGVTTVIAADFLIVAGGITTRGDSTPKKIICTDTVEVLSINSLTWSTVASLPHPYTRASAAISGDKLFLLGGDHKRGERSLLAMVCSLTELLWSHDSSKSPSAPVWQKMTDTPLYYSTCAVVSNREGELLTIGGQDVNDKSSAAIYKYNPTRNSWDSIGHMLSARHSCLVAVLEKELVVVGGESHLCDTKTTNIVEVADL